MEIEYRGANCVVIKDKKITLVVDPTSNVSVKETLKSDVVILATQEKFGLGEGNERAFVIDMPGEYEHNDISVRGIPVHVHTDEKGENGTMYRVEMDDVRIAIIGHTDAPIKDNDLEELGVIDVVIIPVGGGGYTLDARDAATIVRQIAPKVVIPTHFADSHVKYEVPQESVEEFIKQMGSAHEKVNTLKIKSLPEVLTVYELARTA